MQTTYVYVFDRNWEHYAWWQRQMALIWRDKGQTIKANQNQLWLPLVDIVYRYARDADAIRGCQGYFYLRQGAYERKDLHDIQEALSRPYWKPVPQHLLIIK